MTTTVTDEIAEIFERAGTRGYLHAVEVGSTGPEVAFAADEPVNDVIRDLGLAGTRLIGCCEDLFRSALEDLGVSDETNLEEFFATLDPHRLGETSIVDPARTSASTAREITATVNALWTDAVASSQACAAARAIMAQQIWPHRLSSGFPSGVMVAAKTGTVPTWRNEAGVVTYPDGRQFAVAVFTRAWDDADRQPAVDRAIGQAAFAAVEHLHTLTPTPQ